MSRDGKRALLAVFAREEAVVGALRALGGRRATVYSPFRSEAVLEALGPAPSPVRFATLIGFFTGTGSGLALCAFTALRWGLIVQGKPILAWVPFTVIAFELSILLGVLSTLAAMLLLGSVVRRRLPVHYDPRFSSDRFGLLVAADGEVDQLRVALREAGAEEVRDVEG